MSLPKTKNTKTRTHTRADPVDILVALSLKGLVKWAKQPAAVRFQAMVKSGLIDNQGKVRNMHKSRTLGELTHKLETRKSEK
jgi:hypothetical protein